MARKAPALQDALHADVGVWMNHVERFFAEIAGRRIRRGTFPSVDELEAAIDD